VLNLILFLWKTSAEYLSCALLLPTIPEVRWPTTSVPIYTQHHTGRFAIFLPLRPFSGGPPLGRGSDGRFGLRRFRAKHKPNPVEWPGGIAPAQPSKNRT